MEFIRKNGFVLDYLESNLEQEVYEKEQITSKVIMKVKQEIVKERVNDIYAMTVEGEGDSFCLESDEDDQGKKWMDIEITFTDIDNVEHTFLYYNENYAKENEEEEECMEFGQDIRWISSLCDDFALAAEIFEKWALKGTLYSRPWRHQWKGKDGKSNYEIYAEKRQKELLQEMRPFAICLAHLKSNKMHFSKEYLEAQIELVSSLFDLTFEEVNRAVNGQEYWCV